MFLFNRTTIFGIILLFILTACGGGGGGGGGGGNTTTTTSGPVLGFDIKTFRFTWTDVPGSTHYKLLENPDGVSGFNQVGSDITQGTQIFDHIVPLYKRINASYILQSCNGTDCTDSNVINVAGSLVDAIGYLKASNTDADDRFGWHVNISADGNTLAVGAVNESSNAIGVNGDQSDNSAAEAGAVYVFVRSGVNWAQQAYIKASNADAGDVFSLGAISLSEDGNTMAVGAVFEDSGASGVNGNQNDNSTGATGAVYVFVRSGVTWAQQAYLKSSNTGAFDIFGSSVSLSADGDTLAIGARWEDSNANGVNGDQSNNSEGESGAVYIFLRNGTTWAQQAYLKASNTGGGDEFGHAVSISADGNLLAIGAVFEDSNATGVGGNQSDNSAAQAGAVYVFVRSGVNWAQEAYLKASNTDTGDFFGSSVSLSADGSTLAVGAMYEASSTTGVNGDQSDNTAVQEGAVYIFVRNGNAWTQQAYLKASNAGVFDIFGDNFGRSVSISADGNTLAVGANGEDSNASGLEGNQSDNSSPASGAVYVFIRSGSTWAQQAFVKASNAGNGAQFGISASISADGNTLAVGAYFEGSNATGVGGDQSDNSAGFSGAVYLF